MCLTEQYQRKTELQEEQEIATLLAEGDYTVWLRKSYLIGWEWLCMGSTRLSCDLTHSQHGPDDLTAGLSWQPTHDNQNQQDNNTAISVRQNIPPQYRTQ